MSLDPTAKSIEELLAILEGDKDEPLKYSDDILGFIVHYNLKPGRKPVSLSILYKLYSHWSRAKIKRQAFAYRFSHYFASKQVYTRNYYSLSISAFDLASAVMEKLARETQRIPQRQIKSIQSFLFHNGIRRGTMWVKRDVLYQIYINWMYDKGYRSYMRLADFARVMEIFFVYKRRYYAVDESLRNTLLTPSRVSAILRWQKAYKERKTNEKAPRKRKK